MDLRGNLVNTICMVLIAVAYYVTLFTYWGNVYHGPGPWSAMAHDGINVIGAYSSIELFRRTKRLKAVVSLFGLPLIAYVVFRLYWAITRYYWPWIFA
jgi:hypothetical protein